MNIKSIQDDHERNRDLVKEAKGAALFTNDHVLMTEDAFYVQSETDTNIVYKVSGTECECPNFQREKKACKHIHAVDFYFLAHEDEKERNQ